MLAQIIHFIIQPYFWIPVVGILGFLTNEEYLAHHTVVYQYLVFDWKDGVIQDIRSESMDYNKDASYYEAN